MDLLGENPKIDLEAWGIRTNLEHRDVRDLQPLKVGNKASIIDAMAYNGCVIEGTVEHSILFPGCHVKKGAVVRDSVLSFNNVVEKDVRLEKVVSDVNVTIGAGSQIGREGLSEEKDATVLGWNNLIPPGSSIGSGCTIFPALPSHRFNRKIKDGEIIR
jgi:glucose-1-phosphate adenylyltransferase